MIDYLWCFLCGGVLCLIGQILVDRTALTPARILTGYVVSGVVLTAVGIYEPVKELCGAGATVPLTGFGYCLAKGVEEAVDKDGFLGIFSGGFTASACGIAAAVAFSLLFALLFRPKEKR